MRTYLTKLLPLLVLLGCQPSMPVEAQKATLTAKPQSGDPQTAPVVWAPNATAAIQAALNRGDAFIPNVGKVWAVDPLFADTPNTVVHVEPGVVLEARRGGFPAKTDSLFTIRADGVRIEGNGATFRGWKGETTNADDYEHSEWRHGIRVLSASHVRISDLTIENFGGDGIYIGPAWGSTRAPQDVYVARVTCDGNYRNAISVICGVAIVIEDCICRNQAGNPPQAGICIEPNDEKQQLLGILVKRCVAEGNNGAGFVAWLDNLNKQSPRVVIQFVNCRSLDNRMPTPMTVAKNGLPPGSVVNFQRCVFRDDRWPPQHDIATYADCKRVTVTTGVEDEP